MTLDPNAKKAAYDAALPALNRNAAPFHVIDLAIEAYIASRPSAIVEEPMAVAWIDDRALAALILALPTDSFTATVVSNSQNGKLMPLFAGPPSPQPHTGRAPDLLQLGHDVLDLALPPSKGNSSDYRLAYNSAISAAAKLIKARAALSAALTVEPEAGEVTVKPLTFDNWWSEGGQFLDPDTSDVPWFDKRRGLAEAAFLAGVERGTGVWPNFVAPPKYDHPSLGWMDPALPDFRLIWNIARKAGYAVGLHGSMKRDCDLIAAPWAEEAVSAEELINRLCVALSAREIGPREAKPHGRVAVNLQIDGYFRLIDLSIAPAIRSAIAP